MNCEIPNIDSVIFLSFMSGVLSMIFASYVSNS